MNLGIIAYGGAGCRIADEFKYQETRGTTPTISDFILLFDTYSGDLTDVEHVDDDWKVVYGKSRFDGRGTGGDLEDAVDPARNTKHTIETALSSSDVNRSRIDAYVVMGGLAGGTGGSGAPVAATHLSEIVGSTPVYGIGVLPAPVEPAQYKINAARSIQSLSATTDSLLLFDNTVLDAALPQSHPHASPSTETEDMYSGPNERLAYLLYTLFSADTRESSQRHTTDPTTKERIKATLGTGGLASMSFVEQQLPRIGRSGSLISGAMRFCWGLSQTIANAPRVSDWPHPAGITGHLTDTESSLLSSVTPQDASRSLTLLTAPDWYLRPHHVSETSEWAVEEFAPTERTFVDADPRDYLTNVSALTVYSGIGVPPRVQQLLEEAEVLIAHGKGASSDDPKSVNVFDSNTDGSV